MNEEVVGAQDPVHFVLSAVNEDGCMVSFEPEGAEHHLAATDAFTIELDGTTFEIGHFPDRISIWRNGNRVRAWNKAGTELQL